MMAHLSFISQARQMRQQFANTQDAPAKDGMSPSDVRSRRNFPTTRRLQIVGPTSCTIAFTKTGTRQATGVIGTKFIVHPHGCSVYGGCHCCNGQLQRNRRRWQHQPTVNLLQRGFAGTAPYDCIRHDDYRSADFAGPRVSA